MAFWSNHLILPDYPWKSLSELLVVLTLCGHERRVKPRYRVSGKTGLEGSIRAYKIRQSTVALARVSAQSYSVSCCRSGGWVSFSSSTRIRQRSTRRSHLRHRKSHRTRPDRAVSVLDTASISTIGPRESWNLLERLPFLRSAIEKEGSFHRDKTDRWGKFLEKGLNPREPVSAIGHLSRHKYLRT